MQSAATWKQVPRNLFRRKRLRLVFYKPLGGNRNEEGDDEELDYHQPADGGIEEKNNGKEENACDSEDGRVSDPAQHRDSGDESAMRVEACGAGDKCAEQRHVGGTAVFECREAFVMLVLDGGDFSGGVIEVTAEAVELHAAGLIGEADFCDVCERNGNVRLPLRAHPEGIAYELP